jgi:hypothetical protein
MNDGERRHALWDEKVRPFSNLIGFVIYLVVLGVLNLVAGAYHGSAWTGIVAFLNATVWVVALLTLLNLVADLLFGLPFPASLPVPPIRAVAGAVTAWYVVQLLFEIDRLFALGIFLHFAPFAVVLYAAVFVLVLIGESIRLVTGRTRSD